MRALEAADQLDALVEAARRLVGNEPIHITSGDRLLVVKVPVLVAELDRWTKALTEYERVLERIKGEEK